MSDWTTTEARVRSDDRGTTYEVRHDEDRYARVRFRNDGKVQVTVGKTLYVLDGYWNNEPGLTTVDLIPKR